MNTAIALQRPCYKGKLNFDEETYLGVIAFGNALGNSIVGKIQEHENLQNLQDQLTKAFTRTSEQGADDLNVQLPDLNNSQDFQNSLNNIIPKDTTVQELAGLGGIDVGAANTRNANYQTDLGIKSDEVAYNSPDNVYKRIFADDIARGQASYAIGAKNRPQIGVDFSELNAGLSDTLTWADDQRLRTYGTKLDIDRSISTQELFDLANGELDKVYYSRALKDDPVGAVGLGVWGTLDENIAVHGVAGGLYWKGVGILTTMNSHFAIASGENDVLPFSNKSDVINKKMALRIAEEHLNTVNLDFKFDSQGVPGLLNENQITKYHHRVFNEFGASVKFYGGTLFTGGNSYQPWEDFLSTFYMRPTGDRQ